MYIKLHFSHTDAFRNGLNINQANISFNAFGYICHEATRNKQTRSTKCFNFDRKPKWEGEDTMNWTEYTEYTDYTGNQYGQQNWNIYLWLNKRKKNTLVIAEARIPILFVSVGLMRD